MVANQAGNSIVVTDTQSNIRHLVKIIQAVDNSAEAETEVQVFRLKYANPNDVATELGSIFPSGNSSGSQAPIQFGGGRGGGFGGRGGGGGAGGFFAQMMANAAGGNNGNQQRIQKETQVTAVADPRIQAVIVSAPKDLMNEIADMMTSLDVPSERDQNVSVIPLDNADPQQVAQVLQNMFQGSSTSRGGTTSSTTSSPLQTRAQTSGTTMGQSTTSSSGIGGSGGIGGGVGGGGARSN